MQIADATAELVCDEYAVIVAELPLAGAQVLELGCGKAEKTRTIAQSGKVASIGAGSGCHPACPEPADTRPAEC
jgi:hypothetical protein